MITLGMLVFVLAAGALVLDGLLGDPPALYRRLPHPVDLMAGLLMAMERAWNHPDTSRRRARALGALALAICLTVMVGLAGLLQWLALAILPPGLGLPLIMLLASTLLAGRGLIDHVRAVGAPLAENDLEAARAALSRIVGRDTAEMDESSVVRAALESLAENWSDGLVAPLFWFVLLGLPGLAGYKMINTADSLVGHRDSRFLHFGWAAARVDDGVNWIPARLTALMFALSRPRRAARAIRLALRDAPKHVSPNAGWPEAALAGALNLKLGGPRRYRGRQVAGHWIGDGEVTLTGGHLARAIRLAWIAWLWLLVLSCVAAIAASS